MGKRLLWGFYALGAGLVILSSFAVTLFAAHQAITYGLAPSLAYLALAVVAFVGLNFAVSFLRHSVNILIKGEDP